MKIINIITIESDVIQSIDSFVILNSFREPEVMKEIEMTFRRRVKEIDPSISCDDLASAFKDDQYVKHYDGQFPSTTIIRIMPSSTVNN